MEKDATPIIEDSQAEQAQDVTTHEDYSYNDSNEVDDKQYIFDCMMMHSGFDYYDPAKNESTRLRSKNPYDPDPEYAKYEDETVRKLREAKRRMFEICRKNFDTGAMSGYFLASEIKDNLHTYRDYISRDEAYLLLYSEENSDDLGLKTDSKNFLLSQIYDRIQTRRQDGVKVEDSLGKDRELRQEFVTSLKTGYIMEANENIKDAIESTKGSSNSYIFLKRFLKAAVMVDAMIIRKDNNYSDSMKQRITKGLKSFIGSSEDSQYANDRIDSLIDGMRHEYNFENVIASIEPSVIEVEDVDPTRRQDSMGVDCFLNVKISKDKAADGSYIFADEEAVSSGKYYPVRLLVDVKKSRDKAEQKNQKSSSWSNDEDNNDPNTKGGIRLALWSHIFPEDFRVPRGEGEDLDSDSMSKKGSDRESVHLTVEQQRKLASSLNERTAPAQYRSWVEAGYPISLFERKNSLLDDVINGINANPDKMQEIIANHEKTLDIAS